MPEDAIFNKKIIKECFKATELTIETLEKIRQLVLAKKEFDNRERLSLREPMAFPPYLCFGGTGTKLMTADENFSENENLSIEWLMWEIQFVILESLKINE